MIESEDRKKMEMDRETHQHLVQDSLSRQVKDPYHERNLRVLQHVQEKRATLLGLHGQDESTVAKAFGRGEFGSQNGTSLDQKSKSPENSTPPLLQFSTDLALTIDVRDHLVKPKPRHVSVVRPVQYPDRKIYHPVPQALRRPPGNSPPADSGDYCRLPPKKRPYISAQEDAVPPSQDDRVATLGHCETSAFCRFLPDHVMNDYYQLLHKKRARLASEVTEQWNPRASQNNRSISLQELDALTNDLVEDDAELDREVAEIFSPIPELKTDYCHSPQEPWIPNMTDDNIAETDRRDHDMMSFVQKITPVIISLSPGNSPSSPVTVTSSPERITDSPITVTSSLENSPCSPITIGSSPGYSPSHPVIISPTLGNQQIIEHLSSMVSSSSTAGEQIEKPTYPEPGIVMTEHLNAFEDSSGRPKLSMEELCRMVLTTDTSAGRPSPDRFTQTEEEQFAEILEDFLEENKCLPPDIRDVILDMLNKTRDTVAEQKEGILYTAEIFMEEPDNEPSIIGFDRAADDEVMQLINETDLPDPSCFNTRESPEEVLIDMLTNEREAMHGSVEDTVYTTEAFVRSEDERLLEEFERATEGGLHSEDIRNTEVSAPTVSNASDFPKSKFEEVKFVGVEMESTGQGIYDEIADFFGYDGYTDYLSYDYSSDEELHEPNIPNKDNNFIGFFE